MLWKSSHSRSRCRPRPDAADVVIPADVVGETAVLPRFLNKPRSRAFFMLRTKYVIELTEKGSFERVSKI